MTTQISSPNVVRRFAMSRRIAQFIIVAIVSASLAPLASFAAPQNSPRRARASKLSAGLASSTNSSEVTRVIIQTNGTPSADQDDAIQSKGGRKRGSFDGLNMVVADVPRNSLADLAGRDDVKYISADKPVRANIDLVTESTGAAQVQAGAPGAPAADGRGVTIAILDSGISANHPDFAGTNNKSRVIAAVDFTGSNTTGDQYGHGTGVAGMAAGNGATSNGYEGNYAGSAPGANLVDVRVLDNTGVGRISNVIAGINWVIQNRDRYNIRVVNMSLGATPEESFHLDPVCKAVEAATLANIVVVVSAGNRGRTDEIVGQNADGSPIYRQAFSSINSPGNSPYVITVGATDTHGTVKRSDDTIAQFSSKGPTSFDRLAKPDVVAPGRRVIAPMSQEWNAALPIQFPEKIVHPVSGGTDNAYFTYSGTSFSAPVVAGTVALMLQANKSLTPLLVKAILTRTAQQLPGFTNKAQSVLSQGAGLVNAASAVEMSRAIVPNAGSLRAGDRIFSSNTTLSSLKASYTIGGEQVARSNRVLYADGVLFSERPMLTNGVVLGKGVVLGDGIILADGVVLGDGIVLGDGHLLSDGVVLGDGVALGDSVVHGAGIIIADGWFLNQTIHLTDGLAS